MVLMRLLDAGASCAFWAADKIHTGPTREHVWPKWLVSSQFPSNKAPYEWSVGGNPILRRDGSVRSHKSFGAVVLPLCGSCNSTLNGRFEGPAKPLVRHLLQRTNNTRGHASAAQANVISAAQAHVLALWFLKTWLLLSHPTAQYSDPDVDRHAVRWDAGPTDLYDWTVLGGPPPPGLSLWLGYRSHEPSGRRYIPLPRITDWKGDIRFQARQVGILGLEASLVYHPGWEIAHPGENDGEVVRLWPRRTDVGCNLEGPARSPADETRWLQGPRLELAEDALHSADRKPLSPATQFDFRLPGMREVRW